MKRKLLPGYFVDFLVKGGYVIPGCPVLSFGRKVKRKVVKYRGQAYRVLNPGYIVDFCNLIEQKVLISKPNSLLWVYRKNLPTPQGKPVSSHRFTLVDLENEQQMLELFQEYKEHSPALEIPGFLAEYIADQGAIEILPDEPYSKPSEVVNIWIDHLLPEIKDRKLVIWDVLKEIEEKKAGKPWWEELLNIAYEKLT